MICGISILSCLALWAHTVAASDAPYKYDVFQSATPNATIFRPPISQHYSYVPERDTFKVFPVAEESKGPFPFQATGPRSIARQHTDQELWVPFLLSDDSAQRGHDVSFGVKAAAARGAFEAGRTRYVPLTHLSGQALASTHGPDSQLEYPFEWADGKWTLMITRGPTMHVRFRLDGPLDNTPGAVYSRHVGVEFRVVKSAPKWGTNPRVPFNQASVTFPLFMSTVFQKGGDSVVMQCSNTEIVYEYDMARPLRHLSITLYTFYNNGGTSQDMDTTRGRAGHQGPKPLNGRHQMGPTYPAGKTSAGVGASVDRSRGITRSDPNGHENCVFQALASLAPLTSFFDTKGRVIRTLEPSQYQHTYNLAKVLYDLRRQPRQGSRLAPLTIPKQLPDGVQDAHKFYSQLLQNISNELNSADPSMQLQSEWDSLFTGIYIQRRQVVGGQEEKKATLNRLEPFR